MFLKYLHSTLEENKTISLFSGLLIFKEKAALIFIAGFLYVMHKYFTLTAVKIFIFLFVFNSSSTLFIGIEYFVIVMLWVCWAPWNYTFRLFINGEKFQTISFFSTAFASFSLLPSFTSHYTFTQIRGIFAQVTKTLALCCNLFFFCSS